MLAQSIQWVLFVILLRQSKNPLKLDADGILHFLSNKAFKSNLLDANLWPNRMP